LTFVFCFSSSFSVFLFSLSLILSNHSSLGQHLLKRVCKAQMCFVNFHFRQHRKKNFCCFHFKHTSLMAQSTFHVIHCRVSLAVF
jgi:hypothetical protein